MGEVIEMKDLESEKLLKEINESILTFESDIAEYRLAKEQAEMDAIQARSNKDKNAEKNAADIVKAMNTMISATESRLKTARQQSSDLQTKMRSVEVQEATESNVIQALENLNANYIASESVWHAIYSNDVRHILQVKEMSDSQMRDMILCDTGWTQTNDLTIKQIARNAGRMYRNVERSFNKDNKHTLNQMDELRKFWLKPIYDEEPHWAFDVLLATIAGDEDEYKDQLERIIAYRYVRPEDIFIPNPDSSAPGGTGRDTLFDILKIIFTDECVGEASHETFHGTHNGELWGKVWVIMSDRDAKAVDYSVFKNLTGSRHFRLRKMNRDAEMAPRTFTFFAGGNGINGAFPVRGTGKSGEDRRVEPFISNENLEANLCKIDGITSENYGDVIQTLQDEVFKNETEVAKWLGHIIVKHDVENIVKLMPLHGKHYETMRNRQKNVFDNFMNNVTRQGMLTNVYPVNEMFDLFKLTTGSKMGKDTFTVKMSEWLTRKNNREWGVGVKTYYDSDLTGANSHRKQIIYDTTLPETNQHDPDYVKKIFYVEDFINPNQQDRYGVDTGSRICPESIKDEFY